MQQFNWIMLLNKRLIFSFSTRFCSTNENMGRKVSVHTIKKGTGGRSSFSGMVCTVFGSSGFLGRYVCNKLGKIGSQLILPYRGDPFEMRRLKLVGDLGQVLFFPYQLCDEDSIRKCIQYSNVVINLIGRDWETKNYPFHSVHVDGARRLAKLSKEVGVETFIHVSALNASEKPISFMLPGGSQFLASKYLGELAVKAEFPEAIIFRPSDIYGQEDRFLRYYCSIFRHQGKLLPLYNKGEDTEKQPVFVEDVAAGIVAAIKDRKAAGKVYQAVGPNRYLLSELVDWFHRIIRKYEDWGYMRYDIKFDPIFKLRVSLMPYLTLSWPLGNISWDRVEREAHSDCVEESICTLEDLPVKLTHMEDQVPWELRIFKARAYYKEELGEFEKPLPPTPISKAEEED